MKNNSVTHQDLQIIRKFLKEKRIPLEHLSKEMNYSTSHVIKVFKGINAVHDKFLTLLFFSIEKILKKNINDFHELIKGEPWNTLK